MNLTFNKLREQVARQREHEQVDASSGHAHPLAKAVGYIVASAAILLLATIYATTLATLFDDPTARVLAIAGAYVVGASSIVFMTLKDHILVGKWQFRVACVFVGLELALLTLGSAYAFGKALGWHFDGTVVEITHVAIMLTLAAVAAEWLTVYALDPHSAIRRFENFRKSEQARSDAEYRNTVKSSDVARGIRDAGIVREVINEELARLPSEDRPAFLAVLREQGYAIGDIPVVGKGLPDVVDSTPALHTVNANGQKATAPKA